ncbi:MAG: phospholipase D-like domain-containing protein, partial [Planctomycetes bacterium]|nr:phospholipase D-like domain-containing protein [Planctomycetota bacterium]
MTGVEESRLLRRRQSRVRRALHRAGWLRRSNVLRALRRLAANLPTTGNDVRVFHDGDMLFAQMVEDIRGARERVSIEIYMLRNDRTGRRIARALCDKAREGVPVRLIYDAVGSLGISGSFLRTMTDAGVQVVPFHLVAPWRQRYAIFRRNHRKTLVVDGRIGYTGGVNFGDQWAGRKRGGASWRDSHTRVQGAAAGDLEVLFEETWFQETGELLGLPRRVTRDAEQATTLHRKHSLVYVVASRGGPDRRMRRLFLLALGHA